VGEAAYDQDWEDEPMRLAALVFGLAAATAWSQAMTEAAAAAAGSTVGSVAGKQVSKGVDRILTKAGSLLDSAAKGKAQPAQQPVLQVSPGVPTKEEPFNVPPPPPLPGAPVVRRVSIAPPPVPAAPAQPESAPAAQPAPPAAMSREALLAVAPGMSRQDLLRLGAPSSRISMYQDGRLVEVYRYMEHNTTIGVVRLSDGAVARVEVQQ
jgi:hypothetical protein